LYILPKYLNKISKDPNIDEYDREQIKELKELLRNDSVLPTDLLQYKYIFKKYIKLRYLDTNTLLHIAHFMSLQPVTGLNTINNLLKFFKLKIALDTPIINILTQRILLREIRMYFRRLRKDDTMISFEKLSKFEHERIDSICFKRGIEIEEKSHEEKIRELKLWMSISNLNNVPDSLLLFSRIVDFEDDLFKIEDDEDEYEILRRVSEAYLKFYLVAK
jgi:hypothetical protein